MYQCGNCEQQYSPLSLDKLIGEGYWPGSPNQFNQVFSDDLFRLWDSVRKHMPGTSESAFIRSLGTISSEKGRVCFFELCFLTHYNVHVADNTVTPNIHPSILLSQGCLVYQLVEC
jgi:hypothetical protein